MHYQLPGPCVSLMLAVKLLQSTYDWLFFLFSVTAFLGVQQNAVKTNANGPIILDSMVRNVAKGGSLPSATGQPFVFVRSVGSIDPVHVNEDVYRSHDNFGSDENNY